MQRHIKDEDLLESPSDEDTCPVSDEERADWLTVLFGDFHVTGVVGRGAGGGTVFSVEHFRNNMIAAAKWPVWPVEMDTHMTLAGRAQKPCLGVPRLFAQGKHRGEWYVVTELLGKPLSKTFRRIRKYPLQERWAILRVIGRLLLRRLEAIHGRGFIHNDVKPDNVLLGHPGCTGPKACIPYFVDFGTAQQYPGSEKMRCDLGSVDFNSIRSGENIQRRPHDDVEALGWTLLHGLFGELPWFSLTREIDWKDKAQRWKCVKQVRDMKSRLLADGWSFLGEDWKHLRWTPEELSRFMVLCQPPKYMTDAPPYAELSRALGGRQGNNISEETLETEDLGILQQVLVSGLRAKTSTPYPCGDQPVGLETFASPGVELRRKPNVEASPSARPQTDELSGPERPARWQVVGGADRGGVVVRRGREFDSESFPKRLATGSTVEEEQLIGDRLEYNLLTGSGPSSGWVSVQAFDKILLERMPDNKEEVQQKVKAPMGMEVAWGFVQAEARERQQRAEELSLAFAPVRDSGGPLQSEQSDKAGLALAISGRPSSQSEEAGVLDSSSLNTLVARTAEPDRIALERQYALAGSWNDWSAFEPLKPVASGGGREVVYAATVRVPATSDAVEFQVICESDWNLRIFPDDDGVSLLGPSAQGHGRNWRLPPASKPSTLYVRFVPKGKRYLRCVMEPGQLGNAGPNPKIGI